MSRARTIATKVTSAEVARRAGVSQSAVSRVFTPGASASAETAKKVRAAAAELGYRPNVLARAWLIPIVGPISAGLFVLINRRRRANTLGR